MEEYTNEHISALLFKKIIGSISSDEEMELNAWRKEEVLHEKLYQRMLDYQYINRQLQKRRLVNTERPQAEMLQRIASPSKRWHRWGIAASLLAIISLSAAWMWTKQEQKERQEVAAILSPATNKGIMPGENKAILTLTNGRQIALGEKVGKEKPSLLDKAIAKITGSQKQLCLDIPRGGEFKIVLEDSTVVWLNSETQLIYPEKFAENERRVIVKGEAFFKVAHESNRPFKVETDGQLVTVHGTQFNVKSYKEDKKILTTLLEGSISLSQKGNNSEVLLSPGHQSQFDKQTSSMNVKSVNAEMVASWRLGKFVFENQTLEEIMQELSRWYSFEYDFANADLKKIEFMGSIPRYSKFTTALTILEKSGGIRFKVHGNHLMVTK